MSRRVTKRWLGPTVITDGGNGVQHLHRLLPGKVRSILDWFHVSMRVRYLEQIVAGLDNRSETEPL